MDAADRWNGLEPAVRCLELDLPAAPHATDAGCDPPLDGVVDRVIARTRT